MRRQVKAVVFDLDDTLYNQRQHLARAFQAVGKLLEEEVGLNKNHVRKRLLELASTHGSASGKLFNLLLEEFEIPVSKRLLKRMVEAFYSYKPRKLKPYKSALEVLTKLKKVGVKLGLLTDGNPELQRFKLKALGVEDYFDAMVVTDEFGRSFRKPHPKGFREILRQLRVKPSEAVYVGDNPYKDFGGGKSIGMLTIRVLTGEYRRVKNGGADLTIRSLKQLPKILGLKDC